MQNEGYEETKEEEINKHIFGARKEIDYTKSDSRKTYPIDYSNYFVKQNEQMRKAREQRKTAEADKIAEKLKKELEEEQKVIEQRKKELQDKLISLEETSTKINALLNQVKESLRDVYSNVKQSATYKSAEDITRKGTDAVNSAYLTATAKLKPSSWWKGGNRSKKSTRKRRKTNKKSSRK
jgi:hypothetical protein